MSYSLSSLRPRALVLILVPLFLLAVSAQSIMLVALTAMAVVFVADLQTDPMNAARHDEGLMGLSCLSKNVAIVSKRDALDALNCLMFETPNNYWGTNAADVKNCVDNAALNDGPNHPCNRIAYGNWRCSFMFPTSRLAGCLKHDVSYSSLQKLGGDGGYHHMHQFWNPRNKHLADMTFVSDFKQAISDVLWLKSTPVPGIAYKTSLWVVSRANNKTWPTTRHDIADLQASPYFRECATPRIEDVTIVQDERIINASWRYHVGCVTTNSADYYRVCWHLDLPAHLYFVFPMALGDYCRYADGNVQHATFQIPRYIPSWNSVTLKTVEIRPNDIVYGGVLGYETLLGNKLLDPIFHGAYYPKQVLNIKVSFD